MAENVQVYWSLYFWFLSPCFYRLSQPHQKVCNSSVIDHDQFFYNDTLFLADSLTAMETWVVGCLVFVFFALLEYGIVLRMVSSSSQKKDEIEHQVKAKKAKKQRTKTLMGALQVWQNQGQNQVHEMPNNESKLSVTQTLSEPMEETLEEIQEETKEKMQKADRVALVILPILFIIFNIWFWVRFTALQH